MRILLLNPPHLAIGSRVPDEHLPPLGLLSVGGPLIDAGHQVTLLDADRLNLDEDTLVARVLEANPQLLLVGHAGSTSAHPVVASLTRRVKRLLPGVTVIYGGVFPTYHWRQVLDEEPQLDFVVRGEGEATCLALVTALFDGTDLESIRGLAFRKGGRAFATPAASVLHDLDAWRIGWELIDFANYTYWGDQRAVVIQFSRGCPHQCTYCGQNRFWTRWRHRDPKKLAAEIARLHREHQVQVFNFADENPTSSRARWKEFLEALIAENVDVTLVGSTRADDIVRDADLLHLYKQAGVARFLLGTESTDEATLQRVKKGTTSATDQQAIRLLRQHGIILLATWVVGFEEEGVRDYLRGLEQLLTYDPDQLQLLYVTPHQWTPFFDESAGRQVMQTDQRRWDYKHQVLATRYLKPWQVIALVKAMEVLLQTRPKALWRTFLHPEARFRQGMQWYARIGRRVWFHEWRTFLFDERRTEVGPTVAQFWGQNDEKTSMVVDRRPRASLPNSPELELEASE
jgi:anaerobic magnesium-protoporphyrin IX monomethyl ester cyclase